MLKALAYTKNMTQKQQNGRITSRLKHLVLLVIASLLVVGATAIPNVTADPLDDQIRILQQENANNRAAVADLLKTATNYQNAIAQLQGQIDQLQGQINNSIAEQADLQAKIEEGQRELDRQRHVLGADIKAMYVDGDISTIEILATSKDLSDFVDKETYRNAVQKKIQETLKKITILQSELKVKKERVELLLKEQQAQQTSLSANRAEQARLLSLNKQQQSEFNQKTKDNQSRIDDLIAQQIKANDSPSGYYFIRFPGGVGDHDVTVDDYPYKNAGFSMQLGPCSHSDSYPDAPDRWGYCTRQCVSYTAWAVERSGRAAPKFYGSAKNWISAAPASYIHRDPQPGDVAITTGGTWGHAMYVEKVDGDRIYVSQYNQRLDGKYSTQWRTFR